MLKSAREEKLKEYDSLVCIDLGLYKHFIEYRGGRTIRNFISTNLPMHQTDDSATVDGTIKALEKRQQSALLAWVIVILLCVPR